MKYVILVSHGKYADGLKDALFMLTGEKEEVISVGLETGVSAEQFAKTFSSRINHIHEDDEIILLGDLIGGSPLTTAMNVLTGNNLMGKTTIMGGMNLPLALSIVLMKDALEKDDLVRQVLEEATSGLKEFVVSFTADEEI